MSTLSNYLSELAKTDEKLAELLDTYREISEVIDSANEAMNFQVADTPNDNNSANINISFQESPLSSTRWGINEQKSKQA
jgi:hypothetical protein